MSGSQLSHLDAEGSARMVNVGAKPEQKRIARAEAFIALAATTLTVLRDRTVPKGDVLTVARIAGIQAAKRTSDLIPLCHPLPIHGIEIEMKLEERGVRIVVEVETFGKTGVEMEALTGASVAALTVYDMCKALDSQMIIGEVRLISKVKL